MLIQDTLQRFNGVGQDDAPQRMWHSYHIQFTRLNSCENDVVRQCLYSTMNSE